MKFNHDKFLVACGGPRLRKGQRDGLLTLITFIENDPHITDIRWAAYMLATVDRECAGTWQPIEEYGKGKGRPYGNLINGVAYYGRGYTQNTWIDNYKMLTVAWAKQHSNNPAPPDFVKNPSLLCIPEYAYWAMSYAMRAGSYTGVGLKKYINADKCDYLNARRIINGMDHATDIAKVAVWFEKVLRDCEGPV